MAVIFSLYVDFGSTRFWREEVVEEAAKKRICTSKWCGWSWVESSPKGFLVRRHTCASP